MSELPDTTPHSVIIKPDTNYKAPLVIVVFVMALFGILAGYFYYQTFQLEEEIGRLSSENAATSKKVTDLENEVESHKFSYDELTGSVNEYLFSVGYQCDGDAIECLHDAELQLVEEETATDSADLESGSEELTSDFEL